MKVIWTLFLSSFVLSAGPTLIEQRIAASRQSIEKNKKDVNAYNDLALALVRRARETANNQRCVDAEVPVAESLKIAPSGFDGRRARVAVWLCEKRWADALEEATALHNQVMDDVPTWGYIADAQTALGNYEEAAKAVQWMINMRQASPQALQRAATVREAYGMNEPALDWLTSALHLTSGSDAEERAWLLTRIARLNRIIGRANAAEDALKEALTLVPDYPWALTERGLNLVAQKKYNEAVEVFGNRQRVAPDVAGLYDLALALSNEDKSDEAQRTFLEFEKAALPLTTKADNANLQLIAYYSGPGKKPAEAVRIAQDMLARRHDLDTLAACAEALAAQGEWKSAAEQMQRALKYGARNPAWLVEAGRIARKTGDEAMARKFFQQAMEASPSSSISEEVMQELTHTSASSL
jgi:tetratricopeptide (TPR) repeat protein